MRVIQLLSGRSLLLRRLVLAAWVLASALVGIDPASSASPMRAQTSAIAQAVSGDLGLGGAGHGAKALVGGHLAHGCLTGLLPPVLGARSMVGAMAVGMPDPVFRPLQGRDPAQLLHPPRASLLTA